MKSKDENSIGSQVVFIVCQTSPWCLLKWEVSFTDLHTSQERLFHPHGLDLLSASTWSNTARTR